MKWSITVLALALSSFVYAGPTSCSSDTPDCIGSHDVCHLDHCSFGNCVEDLSAPDGWKLCTQGSGGAYCCNGNLNVVLTNSDCTNSQPCIGGPTIPIPNTCTGVCEDGRTGLTCANWGGALVSGTCSWTGFICCGGASVVIPLTPPTSCTCAYDPIWGCAVGVQNTCGCCHEEPSGSHICSAICSIIPPPPPPPPPLPPPACVPNGTCLGILPLCGNTGPGTDNCGAACVITGPACPPPPPPPPPPPSPSCGPGKICGVSVNGLNTTLPLHSIVVELRRITGNYVKSVRSDETGHFMFSGLPAGRYIVTPALNVGWSTDPFRYVVSPGDGPVTFAINGVSAHVTVSGMPGEFFIFTASAVLTVNPPAVNARSLSIVSGVIGTNGRQAIEVPSGQWFLTCWTRPSLENHSHREQSQELPNLNAQDLLEVSCGEPG